jgi:hypothetical protein
VPGTKIEIGGLETPASDTLADVELRAANGSDAATADVQSMLVNWSYRPAAVIGRSPRTQTFKQRSHRACVFPSELSGHAGVFRQWVAASLLVALDVN